MGGFFYTEVPGGAEIVAPVKMKNPIGVFCRRRQCLIRGAGVCQHNLKSIGNQPFQAFFNMGLFVFGNDTYG